MRIAGESSAYPTSNRVILPSAEITRRSLPSSTIARIGASSGICTPGMRTLRLRSVLLDTEEILQRDVDGDVASRVQADESMVFAVVEKAVDGFLDVRLSQSVARDALGAEVASRSRALGVEGSATDLVERVPEVQGALLHPAEPRRRKEPHSPP